MISPKIVWEKWVDPFGKDAEETKWTDYNNDLDVFDYTEQKEDDTDDDYDEEKTSIKIQSNPIKVIASPLGLIPYNEHTASSKIFNFWLGHTNFNISHRVRKIIEETEGVEILDVFTRYRFRIAVGKCFEDAEVMNGITKEIISLYDKN